MKRVLNGVHVLMAVGLIVALAACSGSDSSIKRDRDAAQAAAAEAEAARMAAEAEAAQAAADKLAAEEAAAQAEADKLAAEEAAAQAEADKLAAEEAAAQAEADKLALEEELAGAPKTLEQLQAEVDAAMTAHDAAAAAKADADTALAAAMDARMMAQMAVNDSAPEGLTDAIAALQAARAAEASALADQIAAEAAATAAYMVLSEAKAAQATADTGPSRGTLDEQEAAAALAGARKAFDLLASIPRDPVTAAVTGDPPVVTPAVSALPRREQATTLKVSYSGEAPKFSADTGDTEVFSEAEINMAPAIPGLSPATVTGKKGGNDATGLVYSNIEAAEDRLFALEHGTDGAAVEFGTGATEVNPNWARANIPAANKYTGGAAGGSIQGSYRGVEGTFTCEAADCPSPTNPFPARRGDGTVIDTDGTDLAVPGATWQFEPTDEAATVKVADSEYLSFGYWLSKTKAGDPVGFGVWYNGTGAIGTGAQLVALDEKVKYTGSAAGKYVTKDAVTDTASAGYFTASAELTADFTVAETTGPATDFNDTITGKIYNFMEGDSTPLGDLELGLKGDITHTAAADPAPASLTVVANDETPAENTALVTAKSGGGLVNHGTVGAWEAEFYGRDKATNLPIGITGAFNATIGTEAVVVGGFGATK